MAYQRPGMRKVLVGAVLAVTLVALGIWLNRLVDIDRCLDAGGRYDYKNGRCDFGSEHALRRA